MHAPDPSPSRPDLDAVQRLDEQLLVERVREGDPVAFEAIFRLHHPDLVALAEQLLGARAPAEEVVQDVFLVIWRGRGRWRVTSSLRAYLRRAVRNAALRSRMAKRHALTTSLDGDDDASLRTATVADPAPRPDDEVERRALAEAVDGAVTAMSPRTREVFELRREEVPNREIAARLGLSLKTVEMHVTRALGLLRERLRGWRE